MSIGLKSDELTRLAASCAASADADERVAPPPGVMATRFTYTIAVDDDGQNAVRFHIEWMGLKWAIRDANGSGAWTRHRAGFEYEPMPSARPESWIEHARWTLDEAFAEIPRVVDWMIEHDHATRWWIVRGVVALCTNGASER